MYVVSARIIERSVCRSIVSSQRLEPQYLAKINVPRYRVIAIIVTPRASRIYGVPLIKRHSGITDGANTHYNRYATFSLTIAHATMHEKKWNARARRRFSSLHSRHMAGNDRDCISWSRSADSNFWARAEFHLRDSPRAPTLPDRPSSPSRNGATYVAHFVTV